MRMVECGTTLDNMAWCRRHIFVVNSDDKEGLPWFVCAFDCHIRLERFIIWVWEPLRSNHLIRPLLTAIEKLCLTTKHQAPRLGIPTGRLVLWFSELAHHKPSGGSLGFFFGCAPHPNGSWFCGLCVEHC